MKTPSKKIVVRVAGVLTVVALVVTSVLFVMLEMTVRTIIGIAPDDVPAGWTTRMREHASPPAALSTFLTDKRVDGNAAEWVYRYSDEAGDRAAYTAALGKLQRDEPFEDADSITWNGILDDPVLDILAQAVSYDDYFSYDLVMALPENEEATNILTVQGPLHFIVFRGAQGLALRARRNLAEGRPSEALAGIERVFALGDHMMRGEVLLFGYMMGRNILQLGAEEAANYGAVTGDAKVSSGAAEVSRWHEDTNELGAFGAIFEPMVTVRDSAIAIARDRSVIRAWRSEALASLILSQYRPFRIWGGVESEVRQVVAEFVNDPDPELAGRAAFILESMDRYDEMGILGRWRFVVGM